MPRQPLKNPLDSSRHSNITGTAAQLYQSAVKVQKYRQLPCSPNASSDFPPGTKQRPGSCVRKGLCAPCRDYSRSRVQIISGSLDLVLPGDSRANPLLFAPGGRRQFGILHEGRLAAASVSSIRISESSAIRFPAQRYTLCSFTVRSMRCIRVRRSAGSISRAWRMAAPS